MNYEENFEPSTNENMYGNILIKGTKVSIRAVLRELSEGKSAEEITESHSDISASDILACLEYAAELVGAIDLKKSMSIIYDDRKKRKALADSIRALKGRSFIFKDENGNITNL